MKPFHQFIIERLQWARENGQPIGRLEILERACGTDLFRCDSPSWSHIQAAIRFLSQAQPDYQAGRVIRETATDLQYPYLAWRYAQRKEAAKAGREAAEALKRARLAEGLARRERNAEKARLRAEERAGKVVDRETRVRLLREEMQHAYAVAKAKEAAKAEKRRNERIAARGLAFVEEAERLAAKYGGPLGADKPQEEPKPEPAIKKPSPFD